MKFNGVDMINLLDFAVVNDGSFVVDALVGSIEEDEVVNECLANVTESLANDDGQYYAYESVVAFHTYPWDHYHVPCLLFNVNKYKKSICNQ